MTVTVLPSPERWRRWTSAEKLKIVEESLASEATVAEVARRNDVIPINSMRGVDSCTLRFRRVRPTAALGSCR
jgi:transposase-like protein